ncbi:hypothetical protein OG568_43650 [Streptomyces sp. NBC_01450]|uniref:hypothetical protein n=1 Tax=Streptomyces sp. NBC_01450 TaxID=2903871 RepID=UPI002E37CEE6|nr:hypothetical protein [Streptomyces sp. NBC_01450]
MTSSGGAQFYGPIHGSQIAIGGHNVTQHQYVTADEGASARLAEALRSVLAALETLGLPAEDETAVRQDALSEAARSQPDVGRLRGLLGRIRDVLASVAAGAATGAAAGAGTGAAELAHAVLVDLRNALP